MANNRLFLRCRNCGAKIMIGKHLMDSWAYYDPYELGLKINDFFEKHTWCENGFNDFELCTEVPHHQECAYPVEIDQRVTKINCSSCGRFVDGQCLDYPLEIRGEWNKVMEEIRENERKED